MRAQLTVSALEDELCTEAYNNWNKSKYETEDEYCQRKHGVDLCELVRMIIEEKLNDREKQAVELFWYKCMPKKEIAEIIGTALPNVYKILNNAENKIYSCLEYVVIYQDSMIKRKLIPVAVKEAMCTAASKMKVNTTLGGRLKQLRELENLKAETVEKALKLKPGTLFKLETDKASPQIEQLKSFAVFYDTTADFILFGRKS